MKKNSKIMKCAAMVLVVVLMLGSLCGCREVYRVNHNMGVDADNFKIQRRIVAWNCRTDTIVFEMIGNFALTNNSTNELVITCKTGENTYQKHFIYLTAETLYIVEDLGNNEADPYHYELNFQPRMIGGVSIEIE